MPRSFKTILACVVLVSFLAIGFGAGPVQASITYKFRTDTRYASYGPTGFEVYFIDSDGDGAMSLTEVIQSTFDNYGGMDGIDRIVAVPLNDYSWKGFYDNTVRGLLDGSQPGYWIFGKTGSAFEAWYEEAGFYNYRTISDIQYPDPVPLPPTVLLLGSGLLGLAGWRRFTKS